MTRYIDADALMRKTVEKFYITNYFTHISEMIDNAPTIDTICGISIDDAILLLTEYLNGELVEVVRCKNCKLQLGCKNAQYLGLDGFCSYGERKSNISKEEIEYLNKAFPEHNGGEWFDITEIMTKGETE